MVSVVNLLQVLKSATKLLPEKSQSLLKPSRLNIEPIQISLKFGTTRVKELFLWHMSLKQQEKRMGPHRSCQRVELSKASTYTPPSGLPGNMQYFLTRMPKIYQFTETKG